MVLLPPRREPFERRATGSVLRFINTVSHRERRCAAPARRATEAYSQQYGARSATKRERGACPRKGRQPRRSGCAVRPRRTTEHGAGVLPVRRAGGRGSDKGLAVQTETH